MHRLLFFGVALPAHSMSSLWIAMTSPLFRAQRFAHSPAVYRLFLVVFSCCYLLSLSVYSADLLRRPLLWGSPFPITTGVGPQQQWMLRCRSSSDPPARLCRGEAHSGASLALSPLLPGQLRAHFPPFYLCTHSHLLPALFISFSSLTHFRNPPTLPLSILHSCITTTCFSTACFFPVRVSCTCTVSACMVWWSLPVCLYSLHLYFLRVLYLYRPGLGGVLAQCYPGGPGTSLSRGHPFWLSHFS